MLDRMDSAQERIAIHLSRKISELGIVANIYIRDYNARIMYPTSNLFEIVFDTLEDQTLCELTIGKRLEIGYRLKSDEATKMILASPMYRLLEVSTHL